MTSLKDKRSHVDVGDAVRLHYSSSNPIADRGKVTKVSEGWCESGWLVETDFTNEPRDSHWFIRIDENGKDVKSRRL